MSHFISCVVLAWSLISSIVILKFSAAEISLGQWMEWSRWSTCTIREYCLEGTRERSRDCQLGKRCVGIEAESEMCPDTSCTDRSRMPDIVHAEFHSFIAEECVTSKKFLVTGRYGYSMKHNITRMFPRAKTMIQNSYYNFRVTPKTLPGEKDIYRYCFEPLMKTMTLVDFKNMITTGSLRFKYASLQCPLPKPTEPMYVTGFAIGFEETGKPYGIYIQVKAPSGFKTVYYKHMSGTYSEAYNLIWS